MTVRKIRLLGDPVLHDRAEPIDDFGPAVASLAADMLETMAAAGGVGLAANQIGLRRRIFVYDCTRVQPGMRGVLINPQWHPLGPTQSSAAEGCLSIPGIRALTPRYHTVAVSGYDVQGRPIGMVVSGLMARCVQHETDHLDGVLFYERLAPEERKQVMAQIRTSQWFNQPEL